MEFARFIALLALLAATQAADKLCNWNVETLVPISPIWVPIEGKKDLNMSMEEVVLDGPKDTELKMCTNGVKGPMVNKQTEEVFEIMGIGKTDDGKIYAMDHQNKCFSEIDGTKYPWGLGGDIILKLFSSVGLKGLPIGQRLFVKEFKDMKLPNGKIHNGCVSVDEICEECLHCAELIYMVGSYENAMLLKIPTKVTVKEDTCEILKYD